MSKLNEQITCPHCHKQFALSEAISHDLELAAEQRLEAKYKANADSQKQKINQLEQEKLAREKQIELANLDLKKKIETEAAKNAEQKVMIHITDLKNQLAEEKKKSTESEQHELEMRKKQRELEAKAKQSEIEYERRLDKERQSIFTEVQKKTEEEANRKYAEKDLQIKEMTKLIQDLERKSSSQSQQRQGEAFENIVEDRLKELFPKDNVKEVKKGARGADVILNVKLPSGRIAGTIVFECKNTKDWNVQWISKLKKDLRENGHDIGIIVTTALPKDIQCPAAIEGIWVCTPYYLPLLATVFREQLIKVSCATIASEAPRDQKDMLFKYMTGKKFSQKIQAICERMEEMQESLSMEKKSIQKIWRKREMEIESLNTYVCEFYGDLEGLIGKALPKVELLELQAPNED